MGKQLQSYVITGKAIPPNLQISLLQHYIFACPGKGPVFV